MGLAFTAVSIVGFAQYETVKIIEQTGKVRVDSIIIAGNIITHRNIIRREFHFQEGDSIVASNLNYELEQVQHQIYNTTLFVHVIVQAQMITKSNCRITVSVKERWYIFPIPQFQLVARSFNEWISKYHGTLDRVNYGVNFTDNNITGRKDKLKLTLINGFSQNISALYTLPYLDQHLVAGFSIGSGYFRTREIPFYTNNTNQQVFYRKDVYITQTWNVNASYSIRKAIVKKEILRFRYTVMTVPDSITNVLNVSFFNSSSSVKSIPDISYQIYKDNVDNVMYPLKGQSTRLFLLKRGLGLSGGINMLSVYGEYDHYYDLGGKWYSGITVQAQLKFPFEQPYINQRAMGFEENYMRGLELYVIDGVAYAMGRLNLKKEIAHFTLPGITRSKVYHRIPFRLFAKTFNDIGYVYANKKLAGMLNNTLLYTGGFGLDIVTIYDFHLRLEYSFNQLKQNGLFLHNGSGL